MLPPAGGSTQRGADVRVEVLFFDGCPNHEALLPHLRELLAVGGARDTHINLVRVEDSETAEVKRFLGSPTVRIDGEDVEPGADERTDFGLKCRLFRTPDGLRGMPADEWVLGALERARTAVTVIPGKGPTADALRATFPACEDAPLARALLRLLARGEAVTDGMLAAAADRAIDDVAAQLERWPDIERDADHAVVGFSGLTLRPTDHSLEIDGRRLHTWCAWDTLFLPRMLGATAHVSSTCPVSGRRVELVVAPSGVEHADPAGIHVSFPPLASTNTADITGTFCCHVRFLVDADAAHTWLQTHPDSHALDLAAAFELGCRTTAPLTASNTAQESC
jgi:alkylmercury lyase